jgi:hypothetical protein
LRGLDISGAALEPASHEEIKARRKPQPNGRQRASRIEIPFE